MSLLTIDVGTTGCKVVAFNEEGQIITQSYGEYPLIHINPGWSELDSQLVWQKVSDGIREVVSQTKNDPIEAVSVASQGEAVTPIDKNGQILDNSITSFDSRTSGISEQIEQKISPLEIMEITGMPLSDITTVAKLIWMRREKLDVYNRTWKFLCFSDFIYHQLGIHPVSIDYSLAARTMAFDILNNCWSDKILSIVDIDPKLFAQPVQSGSIIGQVSGPVAEELGLSKSVLAVAGGHDQPCGALGAGIIEHGSVMDATGTVECIAPAITEPILTQKMIDGNFCCYPHTVSGLFVTLGFVSSGGVILRWFRDNFAQTEAAQAKADGQDVYDLLISTMPNEPSPIMLLPHFTGSGTPTLDLNAKGAILGLTLQTTKADIIKAILEGISFEIRHNLNLLESAGVEINEIRAIGGGAKSSSWLQLKADIFGKPVVALDVSEGVSMGAAILAGTAIGIYKDTREAVEMLIKPMRTYHPNSKKQEFYLHRMESYSQFYEAIKHITP